MEGKKGGGSDEEASLVKEVERRNDYFDLHLHHMAANEAAGSLSGGAADVTGSPAGLRLMPNVAKPWQPTWRWLKNQSTSMSVDESVLVINVLFIRYLSTLDLSFLFFIFFKMWN